MTCQVTGEVSDDNLKLAGGKLVLSKEGAEQIISEIQNQLQNQNKLFHTKPFLLGTDPVLRQGSKHLLNSQLPIIYR